MVFQPLRLRLLGGFTLPDGAEEIILPVNAQRLVALQGACASGRSVSIRGLMSDAAGLSRSVSVG